MNIKELIQRFICNNSHDHEWIIMRQPKLHALYYCKECGWSTNQSVRVVKKGDDYIIYYNK